MEKIFEKCIGFQWDKANVEKNWEKHRVLKSECEQAFFNKPLVVAESEKQLAIEKRWYLLGKTDLDRLLFIVFTIRGNLIRVISARDMSRKERKTYYEKIKENT